MTGRWTARALVAGALGLGGCGPLACTEMGCLGTLTIALDRAPSSDEMLAVDLGDGAVPCGYATETTEPLCVVEDGADGPSLAIQVGMGQDPATVTVEVSVGGGPAEARTVDVTWGDPFYPNGEQCDEVGCASGEGSLAL